jgi:Sigma-54 interaction domain
MEHLLTHEDTIDAGFLRWVACQRPGQHYLVRCDRDAVFALARQVASVGAVPVQLLYQPSPFSPPVESRGTLIVNDVHALELRDQIAFSDWLAHDAGELRIISVTPYRLRTLAETGLFLEGLFHRLGAVEFDLRSRKVQREQSRGKGSDGGAHIRER